MFFHCEKPTVFVLEGGAIAGGSGLAFAGDFLFVEPTSFVDVAEVRLGMPAPMNIFWLTLKFGVGRAIELVVGGQRVYGEAMERKGIATHFCHNDALGAARAWAQLLAKNSGHAMGMTKRMVL